MASTSKPGGKSGGNTFLGSAVAKYDVDELDDLGRRPRTEAFVEVRRPDGTIAKARGERTFYGAFTGGFSAGYYNSVGSKEGWTPASFSSSRQKRERQAPMQAEDFMDEDDLRDHRASHRTVAGRGEFAQREGARRASSLPDRPPRELEELFPQEESLGARLIRAGTLDLSETPQPLQSIRAGQAKPEAVQSASTSSTAKKRYGCAPPPPGLQQATAERATATASSEGDLLVSVPTFKLRRAAAEHGVRRLQAELERLWCSKTDLHGVGYGTGPMASSGSRAPAAGRLYMSGTKGRKAGAAAGYADFGTGVFDQDDHDIWESIYDSTDKHAHYHPSIKDADADDEAGLASLEDVRGSGRIVARATGNGELPGFRPAQQPDEAPLDLDLWQPPSVPRGYRGVHTMHGSAADEARLGSLEHTKLLEFLAKHGDRRLLDPGHRADLLGERRRPQPAASPPADSGAQTGVALPAARAPPLEVSVESAASASAAPLWRGPSDSQRAALLQALGRNFVVGENQDMEGTTVRHCPFASDPKRQARYARFCLALEGKASASEALRDSGGLSEAEREAELAEFGRVYRLFRKENPDADLASALEAKGASKLAPVLQRTVQIWVPDRLLCKRWGVPEPKPQAPEDLRGLKQQRAYVEQVQAGLARVCAIEEPQCQLPGPRAAAAGAAASGRPSAAPSLAPSPALSPALSPAPGSSLGPLSAEPPRPPMSLFAAIFGDAGSDDDA